MSLCGSSPYTSTDIWHSVAAVITPVQTVVTRWQQSLHKYRQMSLCGRSPYTSTDSCHSVAAVLTPVQTKQIRLNVHKRNNTKKVVQTIQNTINTTNILPKHPHITQVTTTTLQDIPKWNSHSTIKYPQYKVTLMYMALSSPFKMCFYHAKPRKPSKCSQLYRLTLMQVETSDIFRPQNTRLVATFRS
jgi:hypothetical protein